MDTDTLHEFTLRFSLPDGVDGEAAARALYEADLGDTLVGIGVPGRIALEFERGGQNKGMAMEIAVADVLRALPGAKLL